MKQALRQRFEENAGALLSCHFVWLAVRFDSRGILSADFNYYFRDNDRVCELNGSRGELRGAPPPPRTSSRLYASPRRNLGRVY
jgi:hypothetical protein